MQPAPFHNSLASFKWRGIATTNYDLIMETAYQSGSPAQTLIPCVSDRDRIDEKLRSPDNLALLKLHGCMTRTHDPEIPLILTADQYVTHRAGRKYLFTTLENWALEYPVLFVGSSGQDSDLRALLLEVSRQPEIRPRFYLLKLDATDTEKRFWESKRVTVLDGTLETMVASLESTIPAELRPLLRAVQIDNPVRRRFAVNEDLSTLLEEFLATDVEYLHDSLPVSPGTASAFYRGFDLGWYPIVNDLDVGRRLTDTLLNDVVIRGEDDRPCPAELYVIKAEAGAGKTVLLRRLAWEAGIHADCLCVYLREFGTLRYEGLKELHRVTRQRIFLFVDGAADHAAGLATILTAAQRDRLPLTVLTAERMNSWNMGCERLIPFQTDSYDLRYLSHSEIESLVGLLAKHDSLGPHLTGKSASECVRQFEEQAGRQLLVALHEATMGVPLEDILVDEYNRIHSRTAQQLYLTVCVLNRLNVAVRAGLIARVHGLPFEAFRERLFLPLEHVVKAEQHPGTGDYLYTARHPEIAQIVFERILHSPEDRYNEYIAILSGLNLAYSTDRTALRGLLRARTLHDLFPNYQNVKAIFETARSIGPTEAYIYQQQANYERIRPDGNLGEAERLLEQARNLDTRDATLIHTLAEVKRTRAENAAQQLEREKYRNEARSLLRPFLDDAQNGRYARHTMVKLATDDLRDTLSTVEATDGEIDSAVRTVEDLLQRGLQQYPEDQFLLTAEADYSRLLKDHERSFTALKRAFDANRRDTYIACRLARLYEERGSLSEAEQILHDALEANRGDRQFPVCAQPSREPVVD
jgi:SIR2-like protein